MTLGALHKVSMVGCITIAALGTASGSTVLAGAAGLLVLCMALTSGQLHDTERAPTRVWLVHGLTILVLIWALSVARTARIDSVVIVVLLGLFNRFVLRQGLRDDLILLGGAAVLLAVSTTITPGLAFLPLFVGFVWMSYGALRSAQILGLAETEPPARQGAVRKVLLRRPAPRGHLRIGVVAMLFILLGYLGLTLFPKHQFASLLGAGSFMTLPGATDAMRLTNNGVGAGSDGTVVLRVTRMAGGQSSLSGLYAKVYSLDRFDGQQWIREAPLALFPVASYSAPRTNRASRERVRVALHRISRARGPHPLVALGRRWPARLLRIERKARTSIDGNWYVSAGRTSLTINYGVDLGEPAPPADLPAAAQRGLRRRWLTLPETLDPQIEALARQLTESATTSADKIRAVLAHFERDYTYSLDPLPGRASDPLTRFIFEARQGHCELYAGAVAVLLRVAGVPARVATGYYGGWWNSTGQALEFTEQDAHAWVEAYDPDRGWIWVDATPPSLRARRRYKSWAWIRDLYDTLEALWFTNVVDFDEAKRRALIDQLLPADWLNARGELGGDLGLGSGDDGRARGSGILIGGGLAALFLVGGVWRLARRRRTTLGRRLRRILAPQDDATLPLGRLVHQVPSAARQEARSVVQAYDAWRFGAAVVDERRPPPALVRAVAQLGRSVSAARRRP